jgi:zinc transport system ATP-binding protein
MTRTARQKGEPLLRLEGVGVERNGRWLIRDIDLRICRGEILTLIGPNGSGKTTIARVALGLVEPSAGSVWRRPNLRIGYVPQKLSIDKNLPVTTAHLLNMTARLSLENINRALRRTGALHCLDRQLSSLSGGETQRILLARAMLMSPDLLVLDEPAQGVDFAGETELYHLIEELRDELGCAILLISHDLHIVMAASDNVICLNNHVCCSGPPSKVAADPQYARLFGEKASSVLAPYHHHHDHRHRADGSVILDPNGDDDSLREKCAHDKSRDKSLSGEQGAARSKEGDAGE